MIVSNNSVNAIALPNMSDNLLTTMAILTTTCRQILCHTDGCDSFMTRFWWFTTRPQGKPKWEWGQRCTRPKTRLRPDTTRPRPKNLALRSCWPQGLNIPVTTSMKWKTCWFSDLWWSCFHHSWKHSRRSRQCDLRELVYTGRSPGPTAELSCRCLPSVPLCLEG